MILSSSCPPLPRLGVGVAFGRRRGERPGGVVLVVGHAAANLTEGVGDPQDTAVLYAPEHVVASAAGLPVHVRSRSCVDGRWRAPLPALDTVALLRRSERPLAPCSFARRSAPERLQRGAGHRIPASHVRGAAVEIAHVPAVWARRCAAV